MIVSLWGTEINFNHLGIRYTLCLSHYIQHCVAIKTSCRKWKMRTIVTLPPHGLWGRNKCACIAGGHPVVHFLAFSVNPLKCGCELYGFSFETSYFPNDTFNSTNPTLDLFMSLASYYFTTKRNSFWKSHFVSILLICFIKAGNCFQWISIISLSDSCSQLVCSMKWNWYSAALNFSECFKLISLIWEDFEQLN